MNLETAVQNLTQRGFAVRTFQTASQAAEAICQELSGKTIGFGGSMTLEHMGLYEKLSEGNNTLWHWKSTPNAHSLSATAQVYFTSANAISETGEIVNIDGTGNRIGASCYGHEALYIVAGINKLTPDLPSAIDRARNIAAPLNARRLKRNTPCALSEPMRCHDCSSPERICRGMTIFTHPMVGNQITHVILIEEELGY